MKHTYETTNVHPPIVEKDVINKEYYDNNLLSSNKKLNILSKAITELRKGDFEKFTTGQLNANIIGSQSYTTNDDTEWIDDKTVELVSLISSNISTLASKLTEIENNIVRFGKEIANTIAYYNELKLEFDNKKFHKTITNIQLTDACVDR